MAIKPVPLAPREDLILGGLIQLYMNEPMTVVERHLPARDLNDRFELPSRQWVHRVNGDASVPPKLAAEFCRTSHDQRMRGDDFFGSGKRAT